MTPTKKSTKFSRKGEGTKRWYVLDAEGKSLGRLSTRAAWLLMGKHKPDYSPHVDCGDFVVVVNAEKVRLSGKKLTDKTYRWYTGYPGGLKERSAAVMLEKQPQKVVEWSIHGMLPKTRVGARLFQHLKVYCGAEHPHAAQKPEKLDA